MLGLKYSTWPSYSSEEATAVTKVLSCGRVNYWTGDLCREFEVRFASWVGTKYAVALANGTVALDVALRALGIGPGDEVITTPRTFIASASSIVAVGAKPVFADVDPDSQNINRDTIEDKLSERTKAVICVHLAGMPCDMDPIMALAGVRGLKVIEDCAQAHGAKYKGRSVGSIGHVGAWSFCQDKIMTTGGEGGMVTTDDPSLWSTMWSYKDHGKSWDGVYTRQHPAGPRLVHDTFGTNGRMIEMQAAIGLIQLERMAAWTARRSEIARTLAQACARHTGIRVPHIPDYVIHAWYRFYAFLQPDALAPGWTRDRIIETINSRGGLCLHGSASEVYLEGAFEGTGWRPPERLPVARSLGETAICFLTHPTLTNAEVARICEVFEEVMEEATLGVM